MMTEDYIKTYRRVLTKQPLMKLYQLEKEKLEEWYLIHTEILNRK